MASLRMEQLCFVDHTRHFIAFPCARVVQLLDNVLHLEL
jgi:hypothetical protein